MKLPNVHLPLAAVTMVLLCGCYTQLATVNRTPREPPPQPCPDSLQDSCDQAAAENAAKDTVVISDDRHQVCYWSRNWWGEPELRCYRTYYTNDWVSYYSDPWWYDRYGYGSYGYRSCPSAYYYDPYTGYCRYGRDYQTYYHHPGYGSGSGSGSGSSSGTTTRKPTPRPTDEPTPAPSAAPGPLPKETTTGGLAPYYPGGSSRNAPTTSTSPSATSTRQAPSVSPSPAPAPTPSVSTTKESAPKPPRVQQSGEPASAPAQPAVVPGGQGQGGPATGTEAAKDVEPKQSHQEGRKVKRTESQK
jgi:hypothetical protein